MSNTLAIPPSEGESRLKKAPNAFRTISEVADELQIPQHVLRFWETKFTQVRPLKRGGGRRYYRPDDISLLRRISDLLYTQGYTIKGVQRLLRDGGGRLSDDIPPPTEAERLASEAERAAVQAQRPDDSALDAQLAIPEFRAAEPSHSGDAAAAEVRRLRQVLGQVLSELVELRALLGPR